MEERWRGLCARLAIEEGGQWERFVSAYGPEERAYHNLRHVEDCLARFDEHLELVGDPVAVEFAIWFHDVVYDTKASDNEERSGAAAMEFLGEADLGWRVAELILATKHAGEWGSGDAGVLCDIDLSILGRTPERYDEYAAAIRQEYGWVAEEDYVSGRAKVLKGLLARERIFGTEAFWERYELQARENMEEEMARLGGR